MGTDIHLFVEHRESAAAPWQLLRVLWRCSWCKGTGEARARAKERNPEARCFECKGSGKQVGYSDRNYSLFAMLANVRNGTGFAGVYTGTGFIPISEPRGLPADLSVELADLHGSESDESALYDKFWETYGSGWIGDHSFSHMTCRELLDYDWERATEHAGECEIFAFAEWKKSGSKYPKEWCGMCTGVHVRHVDAALAHELNACIISGRSPGDRIELSVSARQLWQAAGYVPGELDLWATGESLLSIYTAIRVEDTYANSVGDFYSGFIPALVALGDPKNTRIVLGFDS